ncbi:tetratricopeptide repeat protein, partial [Candidatus Poribacteria bacterium]|nr:tetratricopeptide repeat protein [Candidatus Poribacteria bacterium]
MFIKSKFSGLFLFSFITIFVLLFTFAGCKSKSEKYYEKGMIYLNRGKHEEALSEFRKALDQNPKFAKGHYGIGQAYLTQKRIGAAISEYEEALRIDNKLVDARMGLALAYLGI